MTPNIFKYLSAFSFGISFTYFTLGYDPQSFATFVCGLLSLGCYYLFKSKQ